MSVIYRRGTLEDSYEVFQVFMKTIMDYSARMNVMAVTGGNDPETVRSLWNRRRPLFEFLARTAAQFWVAENDGQIVAYARSMEHDGLQELTEFFVCPGEQSAGLGGELLARAFPDAGSRYRTIIATLDERALYRYMKAGVYGRFPLKYFYRKAEQVEVETDLQIEPLKPKAHLEAINRIDQEILGHRRTHLHQWIAGSRDGFVYKRKGEVVGYGYVGSNTGPFAVLDDNDFPPVLAHAESLMAERGADFGAETSLSNEKAIRYFIDRRYQIDSFSAIFMSNVPFGKFENYLFFSPEYFI